jgi:hypothetical protein
MMAVLCSILALSSCTWFNQQSAPSSPIARQQESTEDTDIGETPDVSAPRPMFYDFTDIPVPSELKLLPKESYVFQSGSLKTGVLTLKGRVDINSALNFFQMAMPRENWKPKGGFRYKRSVLIFEKPDKTCVINFYEKMFYTYVEIYVAPLAGQI